jgi:hypothetical protein
MCDLIGRAIEQAIQRRRLLRDAGANALAAVLGKPASAAEVAQQEARIAQAKSAAADLNESFNAVLSRVGVDYANI